MDLGESVEIVLRSEYFRSAVAGAAAGLAIVLVPGRRLPAAVLAIGVAIGTAATGILGPLSGIGIAIALVLAWSAPDADRVRPVAPVAVSVLAAGGIYGCVPETERALVVLGALGVAGASALVLAWDWHRAAWFVTAALAWVGLVDGTDRTSALIGTAAILAIHVVGQRGARADRAIAVVAVCAAGIFVASRTAGIADGIAFPLLVAGAAAMTVGVCVALLCRPVAGAR